MKYCTKGHANPDEARFCRSCGDPQLTANPPQKSSEPPKRKGHMTATLGALLAVLGFFLPWVSVSCSSYSTYNMTFTGWELAAGKQVMGQATQGSPLLFVFLIAALVALLVVFPAWLRGHPEPRERYELVTLAVLALVLGWLQFGQLQSSVSGSSWGTYRVDLLIGFWTTVGGYLAVIVGAIGLIDK